MVDDLPVRGPTIADLRVRFKAARRAVWQFSKDSEKAWAGARTAYSALPFEKRAEFMRQVENELKPYLDLPALLEEACQKRDRLRESKITPTSKGPKK